MDKVKATSFEDLPSVKKVLSRINRGESSAITYQGTKLSKHEQGLAFLKSHYQEHTDLVQKYLCDRVKAQTSELLTNALTILATNRWERSPTPAFGYQALESVCTVFIVPL